MKTEIFPDKQFPNDWHVETIDTKTGDIFQAVFSGPDAEERAREYAVYFKTEFNKWLTRTDPDKL